MASKTTDQSDRPKLVLVNHTDVVRPEVSMLTRELPDEQFRITVLLPESARETLQPEAGVDYRFYKSWIVPNVRYTVPYPSFCRMLADELREASVLHIIGYIYLPCFLSVVLGRLYDVSTVLTIDAFPGVSWTYGNRGVDAIAAVYTHTLGRLTLSLGEYVIGIGAYLRADIERFTTSSTTVRIIHNGVDPEQFSPSEPSDSQQSIDPPKSSTDSQMSNDKETATELLFVGRLDTVKGIPYLLDAVDDLLDNDDAYHLTLVGDGSRREEYERLVKERGIDDHVSFEGYQSDVRPYYCDCDLFVLPSLSEGLPTVLIEAQSCGVPVISTDVGGANELVGGGRVVPTADPAALRDAIAELSAADLEDLGERGRNHVLSEFTLAGMAEHYTALYRELADHQQPGDTRSLDQPRSDRSGV